jgi:Leucine-rich repeat (LRR) protein
LTAELLTDADGFLPPNLASFLEPKDFDNLMHSSKALRKSSFFYSKKAFRIPFDATEDDVRRMLPIHQVEKVTIGFNLIHLTILRECPKLRHLVVKHFSLYQPTTYNAAFNDATASSFMNMLSTFGNLTTLKIIKHSGNVVIDVAPLASLTQLTELDLHLPGLVNITALSTMTQLTKLTIAQTDFTDLSPLSALTHLKELTVSNSKELVDLTPLIALKGLSKLDLRGCRALTEISPLEHLTELTELDMGSCVRLVDISPLEHLTKLTYLDLSYSMVANFDPLASLMNMRALYLTQTSIVDIASLGGMTQLTHLYLSFSYEVTDIAPLTGLTNLVVLDLSRTGVEDISPLSGLTNLVELVLIGTGVTNTSPLDHFTQLVINQE